MPSFQFGSQISIQYLYLFANVLIGSLDVALDPQEKDKDALNQIMEQRKHRVTAKGGAPYVIQIPRDFDVHISEHNTQVKLA